MERKITPEMIENGDAYISVYAMKMAANGDYCLCPQRDMPDHFDVELRCDLFEDDPTVEEYENLSFGDATTKQELLESRYPNIAVTWEYA